MKNRPVRTASADVQHIRGGGGLEEAYEASEYFFFEGRPKMERLSKMMGAAAGVNATLWRPM